MWIELLHLCNNDLHLIRMGWTYVHYLYLIKNIFVERNDFRTTSFWKYFLWKKRQHNCIRIFAVIDLIPSMDKRVQWCLP